MIEFHADWCAACRVLEKQTLAAPEIARESQRFVTIRVDTTNDEEAGAAAARYGVRELPTIAFVGSNGRPLASPRLIGTVGVEALVAAMRSVH